MRHRFDLRASILAAVIFCGLWGVLCARTGVPPAVSSPHHTPILVPLADEPAAADGAAIDLCAGIAPDGVPGYAAGARGAVDDARGAPRGRFRSQLPRISLPPPRSAA
jgi:hypothetical protein